MTTVAETARSASLTLASGLSAIGLTLVLIGQVRARHATAAALTGTALSLATLVIVALLSSAGVVALHVVEQAWPLAAVPAVLAVAPILETADRRGLAAIALVVVMAAVGAGAVGAGAAGAWDPRWTSLHLIGGAAALGILAGRRLAPDSEDVDDRAEPTPGAHLYVGLGGWLFLAGWIAVVSGGGAGAPAAWTALATTAAAGGLVGLATSTERPLLGSIRGSWAAVIAGAAVVSSGSGLTLLVGLIAAAGAALTVRIAAELELQDDRAIVGVHLVPALIGLIAMALAGHAAQQVAAIVTVALLVAASTALLWAARDRLRLVAPFGIQADGLSLGMWGVPSEHWGEREATQIAELHRPPPRLAAEGAAVYHRSDGTIVAVDAGVSAMFGYATSELIGKLVWSLLDEPGAAVDIQHARADGLSRDLTGRRRSGRSFPVAVTASVTSIGTSSYEVTWFRDQTADPQVVRRTRTTALLDGLDAQLTQAGLVWATPDRWPDIEGLEAVVELDPEPPEAEWFRCVWSPDGAWFVVLAGAIHDAEGGKLRNLLGRATETVLTLGELGRPPQDQLVELARALDRPFQRVGLELDATLVHVDVFTGDVCTLMAGRSSAAFAIAPTKVTRLGNRGPRIGRLGDVVPSVEHTHLAAGTSVLILSPVAVERAAASAARGARRGVPIDRRWLARTVGARTASPDLLVALRDGLGDAIDFGGVPSLVLLSRVDPLGLYSAEVHR